MRINNRYKMFILLCLIWFSNNHTYASGEFNLLTDDLAISLPDRIPSSLILHKSINISNDSALSNLSSSGEGTIEEPYIIENLSISTDSAHGIVINGTTKVFIIRNCFIDTNRVEGLFGIYITNVSANTATVLNNTCQYSMKGIYVENSPFTTIENNYCFWPYWDDYYETSGIEVFNSSNSIVYNNTCFLHRYGIKIIQSSFAILQGNICSYNYGPGIMVQDSSNLMIISNLCSYNDDYYFLCAYCPISLLYGILLSNVNSSELSGNELLANGFFGIFLDSETHDNLIYMNRFDSNFVKWDNYCLYVSCDGESYSQASDDGTANQWYSDSFERGNYWSEFTGDGEYLITGLSGSSDEIPLNESMEPFPVPDPATDSPTADPTDSPTDTDDAMVEDDSPGISFLSMLFPTIFTVVFLSIKKRKEE